jgi:hypothetical protein
MLENPNKYVLGENKQGKQGQRKILKIDKGKREEKRWREII